MYYKWPLMKNNITEQDIGCVIEFLKSNPRLTQSGNVQAFEEEWSEWLGVKHSVFVSSGASANLITIATLKVLHGDGEIIVPPLTWVSDIVSVIQNGFDPVFVDINPHTLCMDTDQVISKISPRTVAVFLTHVQGFNGLTERLLSVLNEKEIPLIEDVCESHGATFNGKKLGTYGLISNFSFYFAHHMSTIEGGMVSTNHDNIFQILRMLRSHGMVREAPSKHIRDEYIKNYPDLSPDFIFAFPAFNVRNTEIGAVFGRNQLKRLDHNIKLRQRHLELFLENLDPSLYRTDFDLEGSSNYAFNLVIRDPDPAFRDKVEGVLRREGVEYRRGSSGGGNQLRQPYLRGLIPDRDWENYPQVEHIHFYGYYIGNYPDLEESQILDLCHALNTIRRNGP